MSTKVPTEYQHLFDEAGQIIPQRVDDLLIEVESGKLLFEAPIRQEVVCISCRRRQRFTEQCVHCGAFQIRQAMQAYAIQAPAGEVLTRGRIVYARTVRAMQERGLQTRAALQQIGYETGLLDRTEREEREAITSEMERIRRAREMSNDPSQKVEFDHQLEEMRARVIVLSVDEMELVRHSAEHLADASRTDYFVSQCTFSGDFLEDRVWPTYEDFLRSNDMRLISSARAALYRVQNGLPTVVIRALARTFEWRQRWKTAKAAGAAPFSTPISEWNPNQLSIAYWSDFYDSIYQHPERPEESVIADDESLQNWVNDQIQRQKQERSNQQMFGRGQAPRGKVTMRDGSGREKVMVSLGSTKRDWKQNFKIRTGSE